MDPLTNLYERLRAQAPSVYPQEPPSFEAWLQYWNDNDTDLGNLRNFQHWLARAARHAAQEATKKTSAASMQE